MTAVLALTLATSASAASPSFQQVPGTLSQIAVGDDGSAWAIDPHGALLQFTGGAWKAATGAPVLASVAVSAGDDVWGLTPGGTPVHLLAGSWQSLSAQLSQLAVGADGDAWGLSPEGEAYHYLAASRSFDAVTGGLDTIAVGNDGDVYALTTSGQPVWFNPGTGHFQAVGTTTGFAQIAVGSDGDVWALKNGVAEYLDVLREQFVPTGQALSYLSVGSGASVYGITPAGAVLAWDPATGGWAGVPGAPALRVSPPPSLTATIGGVSTSASGATVSASCSGPIASTCPLELTLSVSETVAGGKIVGIAASARKKHKRITRVLTLSSAKVTLINGQSRKVKLSLNRQGKRLLAQRHSLSVKLVVRRTLGKKATTVTTKVLRFHAKAKKATDAVIATTSSAVRTPAPLAVSGDGAAWAVAPAGAVYQETGQEILPYQAFVSTPLPAGASLDQVSVGADGSTWGIASETGGGSEIEYFDPTTQSWKTVSGPQLTQVSVGSGADVWGVACPANASSSCVVYRYSPATGTFTSVAGELNLVQVAADGDVWGLNADGDVYHLVSGTLEQVPGQLGEIALGADGSLWGVSGSLQVYRYQNGALHSVPGSLVNTSVGAANVVWGVSASNAVYQFDSTSGQFSPAGTVALDELWATFDGAVWGVNPSNVPYRWNASSANFEPIANGPAVTDIIAGNDDAAWATNAITGSSYRWR